MSTYEFLSLKFYEFLCAFQTLSCLNMFLDACKFCIPIEEDGFCIYSATLVVCTVVSFHLQTQRTCSFTPSYQHHPVYWAFVCLHLFAWFSCRSLHSSWTCRPCNPTLISLVTPKTFHRLILYNTSTAFNMGAIWKILRHSPHCPCRPWQQLTYELHNLSQQHLFWWLIQLRAKRLEIFFCWVCTWILLPPPQVESQPPKLVLKETTWKKCKDTGLKSVGMWEGNRETRQTEEKAEGKVWERILYEKPHLRVQNCPKRVCSHGLSLRSSLHTGACFPHIRLSK